jgi:hypothetical protein
MEITIIEISHMKKRYGDIDNSFNKQDTDAERYCESVHIQYSMNI